MSDAKQNTQRPLSPHLQIYRWQVTMTLSILHRVTGFGLALGCALAVWWLMSVISGIDAYTAFYNFAKSFIGRVMLFGWLFALVYHTLNGIRHMVWDLGYGFEIRDAAKSGLIVVGASAVLTPLIWVLT